VPILPESAGYGIVLGFGIFFSIFTTTLVRPRCPKFQQTWKTVTLRGFPKRVSRLSPKNLHSRFSGSIGERFLAKPFRDVDASTRGTQTVFRPSDDFFVLAEKIVRWKKNAPPLMNLPSR